MPLARRPCPLTRADDITQFLYVPQLTLSLLTATAFAYTPDALKYAALIHVGSWIAQFAGHFGAEGRSPALLDNLIGGMHFPPPLSPRALR